MRVPRGSDEAGPNPLLLTPPHPHVRYLFLVLTCHFAPSVRFAKQKPAQSRSETSARRRLPEAPQGQEGQGHDQVQGRAEQDERNMRILRPHALAREGRGQAERRR